MSIVLNTELCWPLAAVGPNNAVVRNFLNTQGVALVTMSVILPSCQPYFSQRMYTLLPTRVSSSLDGSSCEPVDLHVHAVALLERDSASSHALAEHRVNHCRTHLEHLPVSIGQRLAAMVL